MSQYNVVVVRYGSVAVQASSVDEAYEQAQQMDADEVDWFQDIDVVNAERMEEDE